MVYNITSEETQPTVWNHINGSDAEALERFRVSELCKGWPVYRDASEWNNFRDIFVDKGAYIFTSWTGGATIDDFIGMSQKGRADGDFIMHREIGTLVDYNPTNGRAVGKMKATISERFSIKDTAPFDIDCDTRFIFFLRKTTTKASPTTPVWKVQFVKLFYEKDKVVPVDGQTAPKFTPAELKPFPEGYQNLGAALVRLGYDAIKDLPTMNNKGFDQMRTAMDLWLCGKPATAMLGIPKGVTEL